MKRSFSNNSTTCSDFKAGTDVFKKAADYIGKYEKGALLVRGYLKVTKNTRFGASYSLAIREGDNEYFMNIPQWLGKKMEEDINEPIDSYFNGVSIEEISKISTDNGDSIDITFYC